VRAEIAAATAALHRGRRPSRGVLAGLSALLVLVALGALPATHVDRPVRAGSAVVLDDVATGSTALAVRTVRQLPAHPPALPLQPAPAPLPVPAALVLLLAISTPVWLLSRRSRQAYLLSSAGPGPPSRS
jgi:hypothetical protein